MHSIQLFIATSIDGFIARENGSLDWLFDYPNPNQIDHGYNDFIKEIDTIIMGRKTYDEVIGFGVEWPYGNIKTYVVSKNSSLDVKTDNISLLNSINKEIIETLKSESKKHIWVVGGGIVISQFLGLNAIDKLIISIIPIILGKGIKLFLDQPTETKYKLVDSKSFETGIVNLTYNRI